MNILNINQIQNRKHNQQHTFYQLIKMNHQLCCNIMFLLLLNLIHILQLLRIDQYLMLHPDKMGKVIFHLNKDTYHLRKHHFYCNDKHKFSYFDKHYQNFQGMLMYLKVLLVLLKLVLGLYKQELMIRPEYKHNGHLMNKLKHSIDY